MRLTVIANNPFPYHTPILNALAAQVDLHVIYMGRSHPMNSFVDVWGVKPTFEYSFHWSRAIILPTKDFRTQISLGVSGKLRQTKPDIVLFSSWGPLSWEPILLSCIGRQQYRTLMWAESTAHSGLLRGGPSDWLRRRLVARVDAFVSNGTQATAYLEQLGARPNRIVTSCLPSTLLDPCQDLSERSPREGRNFLFIGRLVPLKRPLETLDAFRRVIASVPDVHLTMVGDGPLIDDVKAAAAPLGERVSLRGHLEGQPLVDTLRGADVLVIPSVREVWGLVVNEAVAEGLFVVASSEVASARDLVDRTNGIIFPAHDLSAFEQAMIDASRRCAGMTPIELQANVRRLNCTPERFAEDIKRAAEIAIAS